ncbi:hypothetical protein ACTUVK_000308 [Stenotrophomonas rhizophila]
MRPIAPPPAAGPRRGPCSDSTNTSKSKSKSKSNNKSKSKSNNKSKSSRAWLGSTRRGADDR